MGFNKHYVNLIDIATQKHKANYMPPQFQIRTLPACCIVSRQYLFRSHPRREDRTNCRASNRMENFDNRTLRDYANRSQQIAVYAALNWQTCNTSCRVAARRAVVGIDTTAIVSPLPAENSTS